MFTQYYFWTLICCMFQYTLSRCCRTSYRNSQFRCYPQCWHSLYYRKLVKREWRWSETVWPLTCRLLYQIFSSSLSWWWNCCPSQEKYFQLSHLFNTSRLRSFIIWTSASHSHSSKRPVQLFCLYRPPPSKKNKLSDSMFLEQFQKLQEFCNSSYGSLLIMHDFNFHYDCPSSTCMSKILDRISIFNLVIPKSTPTHKCG